MSDSKQDDLFKTETNWFHVFKMMFEGEITEVSRMGAMAFTVYCTIKAHTNWADGRAFPSIDTIVKKSGLSKNSVLRSLPVLAGLGYLETKPRTKGKGNLYFLKEKFMVASQVGEEAAVVSMDYIPDLIKASVAELKNVVATGDFAGTKMIHINQLNIQVIGKVLGGQVNSGLNFDLSKLDITEQAQFLKLWSRIQTPTDRVVFEETLKGALKSKGEDIHKEPN